LKALLLNNVKEDCPSIEAEQLYDRIIRSLCYAGIQGIFHPLHTKAQVLQIVHSEQPDIVYCADHYTTGDSGEKISIQEILEEKQIPYIGSPSEILDLVLSKSNLKKRWLSHGVPTPQFSLFHKPILEVQDLDILQHSPGYPYILKPDAEGNSRGLNESSIVFNRKILENKLKELLILYETVLVEKYLGLYQDIREFTVAMIGNDHNKLLMPAEIILKQNKTLRIITTEAKENHYTLAIPVNDMELHGRLISLAEKAFEISGVCDYSRCDVILAEGQLYAIEINGQPMIPDKWFEVCASGIGLDPNQYINAIFLAGIVRNNHQGKADLLIPPKMNQHLPKPVFEVLQNS
jgi:D-alanine-D-alanine ligase